jgi:hypothetical protein
MRSGLLWSVVGMAVAWSACERPAAAPTSGAAPGSALRGKATVGVILAREGEGGPLSAGGVTWESAALVVSDVELHACERASAWPALIPEAYAHVPGSPTRLGTPMALELLGSPGKAKIVGEAAPPHVAVCALEVILAPADEDVINATELDAELLVGKTFVARGVDAAGAPVSVSLDLRRAVRVPIKPGALELSARASDVFALVRVPVTAQLLSGLEQMSQEEAAAALVARLGESMTLYGGE